MVVWWESGVVKCNPGQEFGPTDTPSTFCRQLCRTIVVRQFFPSISQTLSQSQEPVYAQLSVDAKLSPMAWGQVRNLSCNLAVRCCGNHHLCNLSSGKYLYTMRASGLCFWLDQATELGGHLVILRHSRIPDRS